MSCAPLLLPIHGCLRTKVPQLDATPALHFFLLQLCFPSALADKIYAQPSSSHLIAPLHGGDWTLATANPLNATLLGTRWLGPSDAPPLKSHLSICLQGATGRSPGAAPGVADRTQRGKVRQQQHYEVERGGGSGAGARGWQARAAWEGESVRMASGSGSGKIASAKGGMRSRIPRRG